MNTPRAARPLRNVLFIMADQLRWDYLQCAGHRTLRTPHLDGFADPVTSLMMGAGAADVETVIVEGELIKHEGSLLEPLASQARQLMHESRDRLRARVEPRDVGEPAFSSAGYRRASG